MPQTDHTEDEVRPAALARYAILDTPAEPDFDDVVLVAAALCRTPTALVSLVDRDRQWFKARVGFEACQTPLDQSVCAHALGQAGVLVIPDLSADPRTRDNLLVTGPPGVRFYAGAPLLTPAGVAIGALCVLDTAPRPAGLDPDQEAGLQALARQVVQLLEARLAVAERDRLRAEQEQRSEAALRTLRESDARTRLAAEAGAVGTFEVEVATGEMTVSAEFCRIFGVQVRSTYPAATFEALVLPEDRAVPSRDGTRAEGSAVLDVEYRIRRADDGQVRWIARQARFVRDVDHTTAQMFGTVRDVTDRKLSATRVTALVELGDALRQAGTAGEAIDAAASLLGRTLAAARVGYATVRLRDRAFTVERDWTAPGAASIVGRHSTELFPATVGRLARGETLAVVDTRTADWLQDEQAAYDGLGTRSQVKVPLLVHGELAAVLFLHDAAPRSWSAEEVEFVRGVADRTYAAVAKLESEARQRLLNGEITHRLKNTMALVQAIAGQTLRSVPDRAPVEAFERRLHALSGAHDVLLRQDWTAADLGELVRGVLGTVGQDGRFDVSGPPVELGARAALSLSLVLHELATNAVKHGALSAEEGRVMVRWHTEEGADGTGLVFRWHERGGLPAQEPQRRGFGSRLIQAGLVGTGGVELRYGPQGFEAEMRASLAHVQQA